jgi:hypothetical protein
MEMKRKDRDLEKESKLEAISKMRDLASHLKGGSLDGLKKLTVASDSKSGLDEGLSRAKEMLDHNPMGKMGMHKDHEELEADRAHPDAFKGEETPKEEHEEMDEMIDTADLSELEELERKIQHAKMRLAR